MPYLSQHQLNGDNCRILTTSQLWNTASMIIDTLSSCYNQSISPFSYGIVTQFVVISGSRRFDSLEQMSRLLSYAWRFNPQTIVHKLNICIWTLSNDCYGGFGLFPTNTLGQYLSHQHRTRQNSGKHPHITNELRRIIPELSHQSHLSYAMVRYTLWTYH